ncbi:carbohydrate esterase family 9 protein, partial [Lentinula raphanica]
SYNKAAQIMKQQDEYCSKVEAGETKGLGDFPEDLQWDALVDVLRNKVKACVFSKFPMFDVSLIPVVNFRLMYMVMKLRIWMGWSV